MSKPFDLKFIPFSQLHISKLNMRHSETAPEIDDILPSVKERGIRQPLIVRREGGTAKKPKYGIVAGRRRWFCLKNISDCLLYTSPSPRDRTRSRMPSSA